MQLNLHTCTRAELGIAFVQRSTIAWLHHTDTDIWMSGIANKLEHEDGSGRSFNLYFANGDVVYVRLADERGPMDTQTRSNRVTYIPAK